MSHSNRLLPLVAMVALQPLAAAAQPGPSAADRAAMTGYPLTVETLQKMERAAASLRAAGSADPALKQEDSQLANGDRTIDASLQALARHPRFAGFFRKEGLSDRDTVLFPLVVFASAIAATSPANAAIEPVTAGQIAFYRAHRAEIDQLMTGG